ncbi:heme oxygenase (biliverdin-producing) [Clostridium celatum]|uniref:Heme oxygenase n=1 Tax=Clostridium celatum DSM 1785 TaxID=545697 RepID=L1QBW7_9CLOT|nr:biliverdin-producing heme oxygenase [Clostridium celatum]EKY25459.1 heme oxygenase [Clostridium celatum DSM 1785]MCE9656042.1 biliverdin-producing heme oxygenase [Clostridium celatum]MDU3724492.1 biliverdin-producing heme oxygenase [Clostridium celatum]MDY3360604.1 biliverdin-producing heme oxygenase [Clostridium celatum]
MKFMMDIREKTSLLHSAAENTGYIKKLVDGIASVEGYAEYIYNLEKMYKAIEDALDKNENNAVINPFVTKELYRSKLIRKDLEFLLGDKLNSMKLLASTEACVAKIEELSETKPELVVAYAYTRFLADLFGGRTFLSLLSTSYKISNEGLNYYQFPEINDLRGYVMKYHNMLAEINLSDEMKIDFINEVNNAYIYNLAISNELDAKLK